MIRLLSNEHKDIVLLLTSELARLINEFIIQISAEIKQAYLIISRNWHQDLKKIKEELRLDI